MADVTGIEWCDTTANLWKGCTKVSRGCDNCYAETLFGTLCNRFKDTVWGPHGDRIYVKAGWATIRKFQRAAERNGGIDPKLKRRRRIFVNSVSDIFDNHKSIVWRDEFWQLVRESPNLIFILVTKRPGNISKMIPAFWPEIAGRICLLVSVEDQRHADMRLTHLYRQLDRIAEPMTIGVSYEPALGPINFKEVKLQLRLDLTVKADLMRGLWKGPEGRRAGTLRPLDWLIMGGESGKGWREMDPLWCYDTRGQTVSTNTAFFMKQMAGKTPPPAGLMTREFPVQFDLAREDSAEPLQPAQ